MNPHWNQVSAFLFLTSGLTGLTGLAPTVSVQRRSDGLWLQAGGTAWGTSPVPLAMTESSASDAPGAYVYEVDPSALTYEESFPGYLVVKSETTTATLEYELLVPLNRPSPTDREAEGADGDVTITVNDGTNPVEGAVVRVYGSAGTGLVGRGTTASDGTVEFALPIGSYLARVSAGGFDFSSESPLAFTVVPNSDVTPRLDGVLPSATVAVGDTLVLYGDFFGTDTVEVVFGTLAAVAAAAVNAEGTVATVAVPAGAAASTVPVRVQKPDPANPPSGRLSSGPVLVGVS